MEILVIFETTQRAEWYIQDKLLSILPLKKKDNITYEYKDVIVRALSLANENNLRGRRPDFICLSDECSLEQYQLVLQLVMGDHEKIKVVI